MTSAEVLTEYRQRITNLDAQLATIRRQLRTSIAVAIAAALLGLISAAVAYSRHWISGWYPPLAIPVVVLSVRNYGRLGRQVSQLGRLRTFYVKGQARIEGNGTGVLGIEFQPKHHPYAADLGLFGEGSLFERICTARTHLGLQALARYLTEPPSLHEALHRQAAVGELLARTDLRERIALLGKFDFEESKWQTFAEWLGAPARRHAAWYRVAFLLSSTLLLALSIAALASPSVTGAILWRPIVALAAVQGIAAWTLRGWVRRSLDAAGPVAAEIGVIGEGLSLLAQEQFTTPKLAALIRQAAGADQAIGELVPWFVVLRERTKDWFYQLSLWLAAGTQTALALDAWRQRHRVEMLAWLDTWSEFEALNSLAGYAYENPEDCWPELIDGNAVFDAHALGHPLLPRSTCVANDVNLGTTAKFWVISGSNMSGKSTLLRSIGLATVLALAGAPVRAHRLRMAAMSVCASIAVVDSLEEGKSRFLTEVQRLRETLDRSVEHPVLFLIDEIFSGTNSRDRQLAADAVVRTLVERCAIGALSTHDVALASIANHGGANVHMASSGDDPLDFDYKVKSGVTPETNAIAIARMAGVPV